MSSDTQNNEPQDQPEIHVHNKIEVGTGNDVIRILTTLLICGMVTLVGWGLAVAGWANVAATGLAATLSLWIQLQFRVGLLAIPKRKASDDERIEAGHNAIRALWGMAQATIDRSNSMMLLAYSVAYGIVFTIARAGIELGLVVFANPFMAGAMGCLVGALIIGPGEIAKGLRHLRSKKAVA